MLKKSINDKTQISQRRIGLQGERIFEAFVGSIEGQILLSQGLIGATFGGKTPRLYYLHPIKVHYEDDLGTDFDIEVFWEYPHHGKPSGMHFNAQVKSSTKGNFPGIKLNDLNYFYKQAQFGRNTIYVHQLLNENLSLCTQRNIININKWLSENNNSSHFTRLNSLARQNFEKSSATVIKADDPYFISNDDGGVEYLTCYVQEITIIKINLLATKLMSVYVSALYSFACSLYTMLSQYSKEIIFTQKNYEYDGISYPVYLFKCNDATLAIRILFDNDTLCIPDPTAINEGFHQFYALKVCTLGVWPEIAETYENVIMLPMDNIHQEIYKAYDSTMIHIHIARTKADLHIPSINIPDKEAVKFAREALKI